MARASTAVALSLMMAAAGCTRSEEAGTTAGGGTNPTSQGGNLTVAVGLAVPTGPVNTGDPFAVQWTVEVVGGGNRLASTGVRWGNGSVPDPQAPGDYPHAAGTRSDVPPGSFETMLTLNWSATVRMRAYAQVGNQASWSPERAITVRPMPVGQVHEVSMTLGAGTVSDFDPASLSVKRGDALKWRNQDTTDHTATSDAGSGFVFDTGRVAASRESEALQFTRTGAFTYHCTYHPSMTGSITVTA